MQSHKKPWLDPSTSFHYKRKANNRFLIFLKLFWGQDWLQQNEKMSIESQTRLRSWYWKRKPTWRKDLITYNNHSRIMFLFNWLDIIWRVGGGWFWKFVSFYGRHMFIVPNLISCTKQRQFSPKNSMYFNLNENWHNE